MELKFLKISLFTVFRRLLRICMKWEMAEAVRFELTKGCPLLVFKTSAIDHSATLPVIDYNKPAENNNGQEVILSSVYLMLGNATN